MYTVNVLLVEDDPRLREIVRQFFKKEKMHLMEAENGKQAFDILDSEEVHLVILDVMLPDTDGWSILRRIRKEGHMPVIMLTARAAEEDRLFGFDLGADDYVTKPFSGKELVARTKALLSRSRIKSVGEIVQLGSLIMHLESRTVTINDKELNLTPIEYEMLKYFLDNQNIALNREQILNAVWGHDYFGDDRTVDTQIKRLRKKLGDYGKLIKTVRGYGYKLGDEHE